MRTQEDTVREASPSGMPEEGASGGMAGKDRSDSRLHASLTARVLLWCAGVLALVLAALGVVLPGLPTTPFVLLAGACFVRASPRAHAWLLDTRLFGPMLREWEQYHRISRRIKRFALGTMAVMATVSIVYFNGQPWLQATVLAGVLAGTAAVARVPTRED